MADWVNTLFSFTQVLYSSGNRYNGEGCGASSGENCKVDYLTKCTFYKTWRKLLVVVMYMLCISGQQDMPSLLINMLTVRMDVSIKKNYVWAVWAVVSFMESNSSCLWELVICNQYYSGTPPYDHPVYKTTSLLQPYSFKPNVKTIESFYYFEDPVNSTTSLLRPGFYGPTVVALTGFHCNNQFHLTNFLFCSCTDNLDRKKPFCGLQTADFKAGKGTRKSRSRSDRWH